MISAQNILFFDCETTGIPLFKEQPLDPRQPHVVQLAAILSRGGEELGCFNVLVRPQGWTIPSVVSEIHGISTVQAEQSGVTLRSALEIFLALAGRSELLVAHNANFDLKMLEIELARCGLGALPRVPSFCTMQAATDICRLPGKRGFKWPKLEEAFRFFFGVLPERSHDALADVRSCSAIYHALQGRSSSSQAAPPPPVLSSPPVLSAPSGFVPSGGEAA